MTISLLYTLVGFFLGFFSFWILNRKIRLSSEKDEYSELSHVVIHELRAYLTNLTWIFEKLTDKGLSSYTEDQYKAISLGKSTAENAINLIGDTLNAMSVGRTESRYKFKLSDINNLIEKIISEYKLIATERKIELVFERSTLPIPLFSFDSSHMYLALHGIIHNAMKYTKDGGRIVVKTEMKDSSVSIFIIDNGIGIPTKQMNRIFEKFFRADNAKEMHEKGSGLGMFIAKNIVTKHNGNILIKSEQNKGTVVQIDIPLSQIETKI